MRQKWERGPSGIRLDPRGRVDHQSSQDKTYLPGQSDYKKTDSLRCRKSYSNLCRRNRERVNISIDQVQGKEKVTFLKSPWSGLCREKTYCNVAKRHQKDWGEERPFKDRVLAREGRVLSRKRKGVLFTSSKPKGSPSSSKGSDPVHLAR